MEARGSVSVIRKHGEVNRYKLATTSTTEQPAPQNNQLQRGTTPAPERCYPAPQNNGVAPERCPNKNKEEDTRKRHKKNIRPKPSKQEQLKEIQESFPEFQEKFPYRNVPQMYDQWVDWLEEKGKRPSNYKASFRNFLRPKDWETNLKAQIEARASPQQQSDWRKRFLEKEET